MSSVYETAPIPYSSHGPAHPVTGRGSQTRARERDGHQASKLPLGRGVGRIDAVHQLERALRALLEFVEPLLRRLLLVRLRVRVRKGLGLELELGLGLGLGLELGLGLGLGFGFGFGLGLGFRFGLGFGFGLG